MALGVFFVAHFGSIPARMSRLLVLFTPGTALAHEFDIPHVHFSPEVLLVVALLVVAWAILRSR